MWVKCEGGGMLLIIWFFAFPSQELFCFPWERRHGCFHSEVIEKFNKTPETGERSCCEIIWATYRKCCTSVLCIIFLLCMGYCSRSFRPCLLSGWTRLRDSSRLFVKCLFYLQAVKSRTRPTGLEDSFIKSVSLGSAPCFYVKTNTVSSVTELGDV